MEVIPFLKHKILSLILFFALAIFAVPFLSTEANALDAVITDASDVNGRDYTDSPALADKLDAIFAGEAGVYYDYSCTDLVDTSLGSSPVKNNGVYLYASPENETAEDIGTSCWIYARGVYHTLFGESISGNHSEDLYLGGTGSRSLSYENLVAWGVRPMPGALIRVSGHSMILLHYDADTITIVDGNGDGNGLVAVRICSWDQMGEYVEHIVQPESSHYAKLYGWGMCGEGAFWAVDNNTLTISGSGEVLHTDWHSYCRSIESVVIKGKALNIGDGVFRDCKNLKYVLFMGSAPVLSDNTFQGVNATVRYPIDKVGWTEDVLRPYGGKLSWLPYGVTELRITSQPQSVSVTAGKTAEVSISAVGDGLTYSWYTKLPEESVYVKSSVCGPVYTAIMGKETQDKQVMCIVKDQYGNYLTSHSVLVHLAK